MRAIEEQGKGENMFVPGILVVEDSEVTQRTLRSLFCELGCEVWTASTGEEAMEKLNQGMHPDVIILDLKLPGMSGADFFGGIAADMRWKEIAVIPFTSQWKEYWGENVKITAQWKATSAAYKWVEKPEMNQAIPKEGEHVSTIPLELIMSVGQALRKKGKDLPEIFKEIFENISDEEQRKMFDQNYRLAETIKKTDQKGI